MILLLCGSFPMRGSWGDGPSGLIGLLVLILIICLLVGVIPHGF